MLSSLAIRVPSAASALAFSNHGSLCVGSDDGTLRFYELPGEKVVRAVRALGSEVSCVACKKTRDGAPIEVWAASGRRVVAFPVRRDKMIMTEGDATCVLELGEDEDDVLNELSVSDSGKHLAFSTDSGTVGVVELSSKAVTRMKARHTSVCGTVKFIPGRSSELVSGGYDSALLHYDFIQNTVLSRFDITAPPPSSGVSLSPPFILSTAIAPNGLFAASTADGRVWLGGGGEKRQSGAKKRSRKWEGLRDEEGLWVQVADGPVVALAFMPGRNELMAATLLGNITGHTITRDASGKLQSTAIWSDKVKHIEKVNAMAVDEGWVCIGGVEKAGKGVVEVWNVGEITHRHA
ncbi:WD40 repeat-like protein [Laetiporus sulphureus 93-53]|uniref:WD40 repeat-like protein n=1 Tax=Laetiporus sulphureus 93-53 TaxID=1314785 RepID=A0A165G042_9APHY|nr:WD40 repeat-like protein [Laetiporus sulphureus 93-53]KZT09649.1 WD40 repeat-like protein [Laetiporus sulphureus 93-53]